MEDRDSIETFVRISRSFEDSDASFAVDESLLIFAMLHVISQPEPISGSYYFGASKDDSGVKKFDMTLEIVYRPP